MWHAVCSLPNQLLVRFPTHPPSPTTLHGNNITSEFYTLRMKILCEMFPLNKLVWGGGGGGRGWRGAPLLCGKVKWIQINVALLFALYVDTRALCKSISNEFYNNNEGPDIYVITRTAFFEVSLKLILNVKTLRTAEIGERNF